LFALHTSSEVYARAFRLYRGAPSGCPVEFSGKLVRLRRCLICLHWDIVRVSCKAGIALGLGPHRLVSRLALPTHGRSPGRGLASGHNCAANQRYVLTQRVAFTRHALG